MFSEYMDIEKPLDNMAKSGEEKQDTQKIDFDYGKGGFQEGKDKNDIEQTAMQTKARINEWYNVISNGYPGGFQKVLSKIEKDGKEVNISLNIGFRKNEKGEKYLSFGVSEEEKENGKEAVLKNNITWDFSNFQYDLGGNSKDNQNNGDLKDDYKNIFPSVNVVNKTGNTEDLGRILSQAFSGDSVNARYLASLTEIQSNDIQKLVQMIDKNVTKNPVNNVYGYVSKQNMDNVVQKEEESKKVDDFRLFLCDLKLNDNVQNLIYLTNNDADVLGKNGRDYRELLKALCRLSSRHNSTGEVLKKLGFLNDEDDVLKLESPKSITVEEFVIEYLSSASDTELSSLLKNKDEIIDLSKNMQ